MWWGTDTFSSFTWIRPSRPYSTARFKTPIAYPLSMGIVKQSTIIESPTKIVFVTDPIFADLALRCEAGVAMPALPSNLIRRINIESAIKQEIYLFYTIFSKQDPYLTPDKFLNCLESELSGILIHTKGIYLSNFRLEYIRA